MHQTSLTISVSRMIAS